MPLPGIRYRVLHRGDGITLGDWHCVPHQTGPGPEEATGENAIVFVRQGVFRRHRGERCTVADAGAVLFFNRGDGYSVSHPCGSGDRCCVITVADSLARGMLASMGIEARPAAGGLFRTDQGYVSSAVLLTVRRVLEALRLADPLEIDGWLVALVAAALEVQRQRPRPRADVGRSARSTTVAKIREIAATRFSQRLSLQLFSDETGYSRYHVLRLFREATGIPIHRYVNRLRLLHALERLDAPATLSQIALDLGFSSHSHFTNAFKAEFGIAPAQLRAGLGRARVNELRNRLRCW